MLNTAIAAYFHSQQPRERAVSCKASVSLRLLAGSTKIRRDKKVTLKGNRAGICTGF